jgi:putative colanic acid biosynthesis UDP-glucose lipid carrier transferase
MLGGARASQTHPADLAGTSFRIDHASPGMSGSESLSILLLRIVAAEFAAIALTAYATSFLYAAAVLRHLPVARIYVFAAFLIALLVLAVSLGFRHYASLQIQPLHRFLWSGIGGVALAFSFFLSMLFLLKATEDYSRATFFFQLLSVTAAVLGMRVLAHGRIQKAVAINRIEARRAVLIGAAARHRHIVGRLRDAGVRIIRSVPFPEWPSDAATHDSEAAMGAERDVMRRLIEICRISKVDDIVILASTRDLRASAKLAGILSELPVSLHVIPVEAEGLLGPAHLGELGSLVTIQLLHPPLTVFHRLTKRAFDFAAATLGLLLLAPLLVLAAVAIKLDSPGPVLFRQTRHGYNNEPIRVFKFRTMSTLEDGQAFRQAKRNDPRITKIGHLLRRTNIDELPQLFNVLLGEMSIVGPRPHPVALNKLFAQHISPFSRRHNVKPGITGWAQVNGYRGETDTLEKMQRRFECDVYYIDNWSFLLDIKIIVMTLFSRSAYSNAY